MADAFVISFDMACLVAFVVCWILLHYIILT